MDFHLYFQEVIWVGGGQFFHKNLQMLQPMLFHYLSLIIIFVIDQLIFNL